MKRSFPAGGLLFLSLALCLGSLGALLAAPAAGKKIVLVAGPPSHGPGDHEHRAGCLLLQRCLERIPGVSVTVVSNGWPVDPSVFKDADAVGLYSDGGSGHPFIANDRLQTIGAVMKRGAGLGLIHYAVEAPKDKGGPELLAWAGGYFETFWSVNPTWEAEFKTFPLHPVTRGVPPFKIRDEWYYHMRFPEGMKNVTPILTAVPPDSTRGKPGANDPHGGNPEVQKHLGEPEHLMWTIERPEGGRGFGFTGGHFHKNWAHPAFRKVVVNALLWIAHVEVPAEGADYQPTEQELNWALDLKRK